MITDEDLIIQIHHIGGSDDVGPVSSMVGLTNSVFWTFYDAEKTSFYDGDIGDMNHRLIDKCIGGKDGKVKFNILVNPSASSTFLPAKSASRYVMPLNPDGKSTTWGEHTKLDRVVDMDINRLDTLLSKGEINPIDVLSIDAQCSEYDIIKGTGDNLKDVLAVICEVEFEPLYEGQKLYGDIDKLLRDEGFRVCVIYNPQYFTHCPYPNKRGQGFLTVSEALFLRNPETLYKRFYDEMPQEEFEKVVTKCIKLAMAGLSFNQPEFAYDIINTLKNSKVISIDKLIKESKHPYFKIFKKLIEGTLELKFIHERHSS